MQPHSKLRPLIVIGLVFLVLTTIVIVLLVLGPSNDKSKESSKSTKPAQPTPVQPAQPPTAPNTSYLLDYGVSTDHLDAMQYALYGFAKASGKDVKNVTIDENSIEHIIPEEAASIEYNTYNFGLRFDAKTAYAAKLEIDGLSRARLYLTDQVTGKQVYDSTFIDSQALDR